jgi:hypothetical protein
MPKSHSKTNGFGVDSTTTAKFTESRTYPDDAIKLTGGGQGIIRQKGACKLAPRTVRNVRVHTGPWILMAANAAVGRRARAGAS